MQAPLIFAAAVAPALGLLLVFLRYDRFPEPRHLVLGTFFMGMLAIPLVLLLDALLIPVLRVLPGGTVRAGFQAFLMAAIVEEGGKFLILYAYSMRHSAFDEPMDGLVYGMTASLGFACLENVSYLSVAGSAWPALAVTRGLLAVPSHGFNGAIMGYYAARGRFMPTGRGTSYLLALLVPILLHGLYDLPLIQHGEWFPTGSEPGAGEAGFMAVLMCVGVVVAQTRWASRLFVTHREAQERMAQAGPPAGRASQETELPPLPPDDPIV